MATPSTDANLVALQQAAKLLQDSLVKDESHVPDLFNLIQSASSSSYTLPPNDAWTPFYKRRTIKIPDGLFSQYEPARSQCGMGLLPEIDRAWVALNNRLYLWDYVDGSQFDRFDDQPNVITSVSVIIPRPGIFIDAIRHLLVLCTPVSLIVLGLATVSTPSTPTSPARTDLKIYATDFSLPTENVEMTSVVSSSSGRIFMCGIQDGNLYEMAYQAREGWFTRKCYLINHSASATASLLPSVFGAKSGDNITSLAFDDSRGYLYALTSLPAIILFHIPKNSSPTALVRVIMVSDILRQAQSFAPAEPSLDARGFGISSIHAVKATESQGVHLVAILFTGVRLYFSCLKRGYGGVRVPNDSPQTLELIYVRPPPSNLPDPNQQSNPSARGTQASAFQGPPKTWVATTLGPSEYVSGLLVTAQSPPGDLEPDLLLCVAPDLPSIVSLNEMGNPISARAFSSAYITSSSSSYAPRPILTESATLIYVSGRTWAISPLSHPRSGNLEILRWNELARQASESPRQFLVLTNEGLTVVAKKRAVDCLRELLEGGRRGGDVDQIKAFQDRYGRDETCAMCLSIAAANSYLINSSPLGTSASGSPSISHAQYGPHHGCTVDDTGPLSETVVNDAKRAFYDIGGHPNALEQENRVSQTRVSFSGRHAGFVLYFSRLVRPIWKSKVTTGFPAKQVSNISDHVLMSVQRDLVSLKAFLERNPQLFDIVGDYPIRRPDSDQEAWKEEQLSIARLQALLSQVIESISFVLLLIDYQLTDLVTSCEPALQNALLSLTYENLLTTEAGRNVARSLVNTVINRQIGQQSSVDAISETLQQRCGSFCSTDDVMLHKAIENIRRAKETKDMSERGDSLRESLRLFMKSTRNLPFETLKEVCGDYRELRFPNGAIELPLKYAEDLDAEGSGREYWSAGLPQGDVRSNAYTGRTKCYDCALEALDAFEKIRNQTNDEMLLDELDALYDNAYRLALESDDPIWHSYLYDWLVSTGKTDLLLSIHSKFVESHFLREPRTRSKCELLWQFYVRNGLFLRAAQVLAQLAESQQFNLTLEDRISCLALAIGNAKSHPASDFSHQEAAVEFLTDLEEKLEVANIQLEIMEVMGKLQLSSGEQQKAQLLDSKLMNITQLYRDYGDPFELFDMKLLILKVSEHRDPYMVESTWLSLIAQTHEDSLHSAERTEIAVAEVIRKLGRKFYPSDIAFPLDLMARLLDEYAWVHKEDVPQGWGPRALLEAGVPHDLIWEQWDTLKTSDIPPYHELPRRQFFLANIAVIVSDWLDEALRPGSSIGRRTFPANRMNDYLSSYLAEAHQEDETRRLLSDAQTRIRTRF